MNNELVILSTPSKIKPNTTFIRTIALLYILFLPLSTVVPLIHASSESVSLPLGIAHFLPVTLMNNQSSDTPAPFQQMVVINSSTYSMYEADNLQNIEFFYFDGTVIPSWLERGNTSNSASSIYWLKIANGIPAYSSITIYMGFSSISTNLFNSQTTGEAPQLSSARALTSIYEYDDGANIFNVYANFESASLPIAWQLQGSAKFIPNKGIETVDGNGWEEGAAIYAESMAEQNIVIEASTSYFGSADNQNIGFCANGTPSGIGGGGGQAPNGYAVSFNPYYGNSGLYQNAQSTPLVSSPVFPSSSGYSFQQVFISSKRADYKFASNSSQYQAGVYNQLTAGFTYLASSNDGNVGQNPNIRNIYGNAYFSSSTGAASSTQYVYWLRVRALPPNGVMPSVTIGYRVTFVEIGLPLETTWSVILSNVGTHSSTDNTITFLLPSGNYGYSIGTLKNYAFDPSAGSLSVVSSTSINIGAHFNWFATVSLSQLAASILLLICLSLLFVGVSKRQKRKQNTP